MTVAKGVQENTAGVVNSADQGRFVALLEEHKGILFKVANAYCVNVSDQADLVQEISLQLWRSFPSFDRERRFSTWMYRVALNVAISSTRDQSRRPLTQSTDGERLLELSTERDEFELAAERSLLQAFITRLDVLDRALIVLYLDGHSHREIAEVLGISASNVGTKIDRIKRKLKQSATSTGG